MGLIEFFDGSLTEKLALETYNSVANPVRSNSQIAVLISLLVSKNIITYKEFEENRKEKLQEIIEETIELAKVQVIEESKALSVEIDIELFGRLLEKLFEELK